MRLPVGPQDAQWFEKDGTPTTYAFERLKALLDALSTVQTVTAGFTLNKNHDASIVVINAAAGAAFVLPKSDGGGARYRFIIGTTITSNSTTIKVANSIDAFVGYSQMVSDDPATVKGFVASPGSDDTITFNGTTKGGYIGDYVEIIDIAAGTFFVRITGKQTGTEATMFSATV